MAYEGPFDTTGYQDESTNAAAHAETWSANAYDAWSVGDSDAYVTDTAIAGDLDTYSGAYEDLAADPLDSGAYGDAYDAASSASWDAWGASVDAYAAGDYETAEYYEQASYAYEDAANATWDAWDDASPYAYDPYAGADPYAYGGSSYDPYAGSYGADDAYYDTYGGSEGYYDAMSYDASDYTYDAYAGTDASYDVYDSAASSGYADVDTSYISE